MRRLVPVTQSLSLRSLLSTGCIRVRCLSRYQLHAIWPALGFLSPAAVVPVVLHSEVNNQGLATWRLQSIDMVVCDVTFIVVVCFDFPVLRLSDQLPDKLICSINLMEVCIGASVANCFVADAFTIDATKAKIGAILAQPNAGDCLALKGLHVVITHRGLASLA
jgi:hypothetical protein